MGVGMKSMTNSTQVIRMLHRFGQSISPVEEEGILTEIAEAVTSCNIILPHGLYAGTGRQVQSSSRGATKHVFFGKVML